MYLINRLAKIAGISTRTLRYYDNIGLLKPTSIDSSGYRRYNQEQVDRLQHILMYKKLGFDLKRIKSILDDNFMPLDALLEHRKTILNDIDALKSLMKTVDKTIAYYKGETDMSDKEKFEGLKEKQINENEEKYGKEVREKYGDQTIDESNIKFMKQSKNDYDHANELSIEILSLLKAALVDNDPQSSLAQKVCEKHQQWIKLYWPTYDKNAHLSLVQMYLADERFKAYYERVGEGATQLLVDAMTIYLSE